MAKSRRTRPGAAATQLFLIGLDARPGLPVAAERADAAAAHGVGDAPADRGAADAGTPVSTSSADASVRPAAATGEDTGQLVPDGDLAARTASVETIPEAAPSELAESGATGRGSVPPAAAPPMVEGAGAAPSPPAPRPDPSAPSASVDARSIESAFLRGGPGLLEDGGVCTSDQDGRLVTGHLPWLVARAAGRAIEVTEHAYTREERFELGVREQRLLQCVGDVGDRMYSAIVESGLSAGRTQQELCSDTWLDVSPSWLSQAKRIGPLIDRQPEALTTLRPSDLRELITRGFQRAVTQSFVDERLSRGEPAPSEHEIAERLQAVQDMHVRRLDAAKADARARSGGGRAPSGFRAADVVRSSLAPTRASEPTAADQPIDQPPKPAIDLVSMAPAKEQRRVVKMTPSLQAFRAGLGDEQRRSLDRALKDYSVRLLTDLQMKIPARLQT